MKFKIFRFTGILCFGVMLFSVFPFIKEEVKIILFLWFFVGLFVAAIFLCLDENEMK